MDKYNADTENLFEALMDLVVAPSLVDVIVFCREGGTKLDDVVDEVDALDGASIEAAISGGCVSLIDGSRETTGE